MATATSRSMPIFLLGVILIIGIYFRFTNLEDKVYWHDETYTSLRISGFTSQEMIQQVFKGQIVDFEKLQQYQSLNPDKNLADVLNSLAVDDPQHPPLYYLLLRLWVHFWGSSVTVIRSLSALISLLIFPAVYWFCYELFLMPQVGLMAMGLMAISPVHLVYAQEAREYILWGVAVLLTNAALLRAIREKTRLSWVLYALTLAMSFYSFILTGLVALGHAVYVLFTEKFQLSRTLIPYLIASLLAFMAFLPWVLVLVNNYARFQVSTAWTGSIQVPWQTLLQAWVLHVVRIFFDFDLDFSHPLNLISFPLVLSLVGYSIYALTQQTPNSVWLFIVIWLAATSLPLMLPDLISGGVRSASHRYLIPSFLAIQVSVAYLLATHLFNGKYFYQKRWKMLTAVLISVGIASCSVNSHAETWWNKLLSYNLPTVAQIINGTDNPLVVSHSSNTNLGNILSLSYLVSPSVKFQLVADSKIPIIPPGFKNVFLLNPSEAMKFDLERQLDTKANFVFGDDYIQVLSLLNSK
ncbi:MAG TPA: glycosyltransferase family 39 protein [Leptolyngbyaceae cyanobacterium]